MSSIPQQQNMILEYTPADFFYLTNASDMPKGGCGSTPIACTNISAGVACYQQELCRNKELVDLVRRHPRGRANCFAQRVMAFEHCCA